MFQKPGTKEYVLFLRASPGRCEKHLKIAVKHTASFQPLAKKSDPVLPDSLIVYIEDLKSGDEYIVKVEPSDLFPKHPLDPYREEGDEHDPLLKEKKNMIPANLSDREVRLLKSRLKARQSLLWFRLLLEQFLHELSQAGESKEESKLDDGAQQNENEIVYLSEDEISIVSKVLPYSKVNPQEEKHSEDQKAAAIGFRIRYRNEKVTMSFVLQIPRIVHDLQESISCVDERSVEESFRSSKRDMETLLQDVEAENESLEFRSAALLTPDKQPGS